jgi:hypothetical protein
MPESSGDELSSRLARYPKEALPFFDGAFGIAAALSEDARRLVFEAVIENFRRGARRLSGSVLEPFTNLSESDAEQLGSVYSLVMGLLSETAACPEEFVSRAEGILFTDARGEIAHTIAISICELRPGIVGVIERAQLAREVLPSLLALEIAIDVRLRVCRWASDYLHFGGASPHRHRFPLAEADLWRKFFRRN